MSLEERRLALEERRELRLGGLEERRMALEERREQRLGEIEKKQLALDERREERLLATYGGREPGAPTPKRDSKITEYQQMWSRFWFASGAQMLPNSQDPYISRVALIDMLISDGFSEHRIKVALNPSGPSLVGSLVGSELIRPSGHGWVALGVFADDLRAQQKVEMNPSALLRPYRTQGTQ